MATDSNLELETSIARSNSSSIIFLKWGNVTMMSISIVEDGGPQWISTSKLSHQAFGRLSFIDKEKKFYQIRIGSAL